MKNDVICISPKCQDGYYIWPAVFFNFDRPEMYEGGALEWKIEENCPKLCGRTMCLKDCSAIEWNFFCSPLQRQVHIAPLQLFGAKFLPTSTAAHRFSKIHFSKLPTSTAAHRFFKITFLNFFGFTAQIPGTAPQNGHSPSKSWTPVVTPFVPSSGRHQNYNRNIKFDVSAIFFDAFFKVEPNGLTTGTKFKICYGWPITTFKQRIKSLLISQFC